MPSALQSIEPIAERLGTSPTLLAALLTLLAVLLVCTIWRLAVIRIRRTEHGHKLKASLLTWWILFTLLAGALLIGRTGVIVLMAVTSMMGLHEFLRLMPEHVRRGRSWLYLAVGLHYLLVYLEWWLAVIAFIPVAVFLLLPLRAMAAGRVEGFIAVYSAKLLGLMLTTLTLSHVPLVFLLSPADAAQGALLVLYLLILTEGNDIAQALWGRAFGKRRIVPRVSPNKALEGFIGGVSTTVVLAVLLAPLLTDFSSRTTWLEKGTGIAAPALLAAIVGLAIALAGIAGDLTMSAIKRDAGFKDTGSLLPGHGGILDRIDSLLFAAPVFFWMMTALSA